ncbi:MULTISPECIES: NUDIX hydrolase [unclassified Sphingomonas]|uniref:NUDIX hydrolase n=1 Tax=unclassified Sphingomonas TaxID=196159 RepID=UPI0007013BD9|nr:MULTISPECIES: NUDIX domain-containing protein [unclassified Sphingomonas]KQX18033.1 NUDIX hydrolase [Sphingomonas sp. Root1294]KQY70958.1 NUDIX hydrolase [Sphingomonas sp. Root50]KRB91544.1 NUDIX hydrolase [Sphingomonas sp. Root720]
MKRALRSAGLLVWRRRAHAIDVLLVHPGGPYWRNKDAGAWQIPKGLIEPGEQPVAAAFREAEEELGMAVRGAAAALGEIRQAGGKIVEAFAVEADLDPAALCSNSFEMEWPPRSGRVQSFPEIDAARWFDSGAARGMMLASQIPLLDRLLETITLPK